MLIAAVLSGVMLASPGLGDAKIEDLAWMAGTWSCEKWGGTFEEHWMKPSGGTMQGVGRHLKDGKTGFMEFLSIEPSDKGLTMWILLGAPSKGEKKGVAFHLVSSGKGKAAFASPTNDFPARISYEARADGSMLCRLTGKQNGKEEVEEFEFRRGMALQSYQAKSFIPQSLQ